MGTHSCSGTCGVSTHLTCWWIEFVCTCNACTIHVALTRRSTAHQHRIYPRRALPCQTYSFAQELTKQRRLRNEYAPPFNAKKDLCAISLSKKQLALSSKTAINCIRKVAHQNLCMRAQDRPSKHHWCTGMTRSPQVNGFSHRHAQARKIPTSSRVLSTIAFAWSSRSSRALSLVTLSESAVRPWTMCLRASVCVELNLHVPLNKIWHGRRPHMLRKVCLAYARTLCEHKKEDVCICLCHVWRSRFASLMFSIQYVLMCPVVPQSWRREEVVYVWGEKVSVHVR